MIQTKHTSYPSLATFWHSLSPNLTPFLSKFVHVLYCGHLETFRCALVRDRWDVHKMWFWDGDWSSTEGWIYRTQAYLSSIQTKNNLWIAYYFKAIMLDEMRGALVYDISLRSSTLYLTRHTNFNAIQDWRHVTVAFEDCSLVEKVETVQVYFTLEGEGLWAQRIYRGWKVYMDSYMANFDSYMFQEVGLMQIPTNHANYITSMAFGEESWVLTIT